jgi:hypothetical protein
MSEFPNDFNFDLYRLFYEDLRNYDNNFLRNHYLNFGKNEGRYYKLPDDFTVESYKELNNDLNHLNNNDLMKHYINYGIKECRKYKIISNQNVIFVVARYNEDISNFAEYNNNLVVYNKGNDDINTCINRSCIKNVPNLGREAGTYCNYILDNYDNLPEYMIFTQGNPCDHVAIFDKLTTFNKFREIFNEHKNYKFKYISSHKEPVDLDSLAHIGLGVYVTPIELGNPKNINELINDIQKWVNEKCPSQNENSNEVINKLNSFG